MKKIMVAALIGSLTAGAQAQTPPPGAVKPDPANVTAMLPAEIPWRQTGTGQFQAPLFGDPNKPGPYGVLIKWLPGNYSRPHFHTTDRYAYVISGTWWKSDSRTYDPAKTYPYPAGSFVTDLAGKVHWDGAKDGEVVIEIVGMGPMTTTRLP